MESASSWNNRLNRSIVHHSITVSETTLYTIVLNEPNLIISNFSIYSQDLTLSTKEKKDNPLSVSFCIAKA